MRLLLGLAFLAILSVLAGRAARNGGLSPTDGPRHPAQVATAPVTTAAAEPSPVLAVAVAGSSAPVDASLPQESAVEGWRAMSEGSARNADEVDLGSMIAGRVA